MAAIPELPDCQHCGHPLEDHLQVTNSAIVGAEFGSDRVCPTALYRPMDEAKGDLTASEPTSDTVVEDSTDLGEG